MIEPYEIDLHWVAFQYLTDELSPAEAKAFERQLAEDQHARIALSQAVEWCEAALALPAEVVRNLPYAESAAMPALATRHVAGEPAGWLRPAGWMAMGAAACLALVMGVQVLSTSGAGLFGIGSTDPSPQLALAWARTQSELSPDLQVWLDEVFPLLDNHEIRRPDHFASDDENSLRTTSWVIAAVEQKPAPHDEDDSEEK